MIEDLDVGDMVVFKDGFEGVVDNVEYKNHPYRLVGGSCVDYHLNTGYYVRYVLGEPEINKKMENRIAKVIRHDKTRGHTQG